METRNRARLNRARPNPTVDLVQESTRRSRQSSPSLIDIITAELSDTEEMDSSSEDDDDDDTSEAEQLPAPECINADERIPSTITQATTSTVAPERRRILESSLNGDEESNMRSRDQSQHVNHSDFDSVDSETDMSELDSDFTDISSITDIHTYLTSSDYGDDHSDNSSASSTASQLSLSSNPSSPASYNDGSNVTSHSLMDAEDDIPAATTNAASPLPQNIALPQGSYVCGGIPATSNIEEIHGNAEAVASTANKSYNIHNKYNDESEEGQMCSICFEPWSNSGHHRLSSLRCGHLFGKTCIEKWLHGSHSKCPQCNAKATKRDIRIIYAKALKAIDTSEKDRLAKELEDMKDKYLNLEKVNATLSLKNQLDTQKVSKLQEELRMLKSTVSYPDNFNDPTVTEKRQYQLISCETFVLTKEDQCRVMAFNEWMNMLVVSVASKNPTVFAGHGIKKINVLDMKVDKLIPLHKKQIRDLAFNPERKDLLLSVSMDKTAKIVNVANNTVLNSYSSTEALWSCCWHSDCPTSFFVGSANGSIYRYDTKDSSDPIQYYSISGSGPIISLSYIPLNSNAEFPHSGLLVTRFNAISFVEFLSDDIRKHELPLEGPFVNTSYDTESRRILITCRPTQRNSHARHAICQLHAYVENETLRISASEVHSFQGGTTMNVLTRACLTPNPCVQNETVAIFSEENTCHCKIFDMQSGSLLQVLTTHSNVIDILPLKCQNNNYVALLTDKKATLYKWIEKLAYHSL